MPNPTPHARDQREREMTTESTLKGTTMPESKHTAGPWHWDAEEREILDPKLNRVSGCCNAAGDLDTSLDDCLLMAAAPELLKALRNTLAAMANGRPSMPEFGTKWDKTVLAAQAAIAKATGETK